MPKLKSKLKDGTVGCVGNSTPLAIIVGGTGGI